MRSEAATFTNPEVCQLLDEDLEEVELTAVLHAHLVGVGQHCVVHPWFHFLLSSVSCLTFLPLLRELNCDKRREQMSVHGGPFTTKWLVCMDKLEQCIFWNLSLLEMCIHLGNCHANPLAHSCLPV